MIAAQTNKSSAFAAAQSGDDAQLEVLVQENLALVKFVVKRFLGRGKEYDDLYQTGCIGLVKAVRKFDCSLGVQFSTYAVPLIMGEIRRFLRDDNAVHISRSLHDLSGKIVKYRQEYEKVHGRLPTLREICAAVDGEEESVLLAMNAALRVKSLQEPVQGSEELMLGDTIAVHSMDGVEDRLLIRNLLASLDEIERQVIIARFFERKTQKEVGNSCGLTQVQVSRLESRIIRKMRSCCGC